MTRSIQARLMNANEQAKTFNNREMLTGLPDTDYSQIALMVKEFQPYYNLWTTVDNWKKSHKSWMYDELALMDSQKLEETVDNSNKIMAQVIRLFRDKELPGILKIAESTKAVPNVLKACTREGLLDKFQDANRNLDLVQRGLRDYLEQKRSIFARFYFLSNDELLEILSQTKEVENVRPHLRKVFENMADLEFKSDKTIIAMYSGEREKIQLLETVDPREKGVEFWMGEVERMMFRSVRHVLKYSVDDYLVKARTDWILVHPGQCVLNGSQVHWTAEVEEAMMKEGVAGVSKYLQKLDA